jgi:hypothetical protein
MSKTRKVSEPELPEIPLCPRCNNPILIGDTSCTRCGYRVRQPLRQQLRQQPASVVSTTLFILGLLVAMAAIGMAEPARYFVLAFGTAFIIAGGLYYAFDLLVLNASDRRDPKN